MRDGYTRVCKHVLEKGHFTAPRGETTREVIDAVIVLDRPWDALPIGVGRKPNLAIAAAEAAQLIGGVSHPELMVRITKNFDRFRDGGVFHGAYGPRTRSQLPTVIERLREDPETRQAVVTLWDPLHDLFSAPRDLPCTVMLQFLIRRDRLQLHTTMRSNDVWWGLAYDAFQFTQLQLAVANVLGVEPGRYYHHAVSLHAYERDWESIEALIDSDGTEGDDRVTAGFGTPGLNDWDGTAQIAREVLEGKRPAADSCAGWYHEQLEQYLR